MSRFAALVVALAAVAGGCAHALGPVDAGSALGRANRANADPDAAQLLMQAAEAAFAARPDLARVREAERLWLQAAVTDATDAEPIIGAVRAQVWLAENDPDQERRRDTATESVSTAQWCSRRDPADPTCSYWLALAVGVQANQRRATADDGLKVMVRALHNAIDRGERTDSAGPHRVLALVLLRAPGWPMGPGDPDTGLVHAERAVELFPDFAPNWLALGEALHETGQPARSLAAYRCALEAAATRESHPDSRDWTEEAQVALAGNPEGNCRLLR
jgi:tetratricopeptide (TPR) repeat protein